MSRHEINEMLKNIKKNSQNFNKLYIIPVENLHIFPAKLRMYFVQVITSFL